MDDPHLPYSAKAKIICDVAASLGQRTEQSSFRVQAQVQMEFAFRALAAADYEVTLEHAYDIFAVKEMLEEVTARLKETGTPEAASLLKHYEQAFLTPAGTGFGALLYNYDGDVYASDEGRMLAEMGDREFHLGNVHRDSWENIYLESPILDIAYRTMTEGMPGCSECAFQPWCGSDPVRHHATQGDVVGHCPTSAFCKRNMETMRYLVRLLEDDPEAAALDVCGPYSVRQRRIGAGELTRFRKIHGIALPVTRQPTFFYRLLAWITAIVLLGACAVAPRTHVDDGAARSADRECAINSTACQQVTLLATHTFVAKPAFVPLSWRSLDIPFVSTTHRRLVTCPAGSLARTPVERAIARYARPTLVGVVEFRI